MRRAAQAGTACGPSRGGDGAAAHQQADLLDGDLADRPRRRQPPAGDDGDAIADGKISSRSCEMTTTAAPLAARSSKAWWIGRGRAGIHAPGRLRDDQHAGLLQDLAPDDELLQIAAGEAARLRWRRRWCARRSPRITSWAKPRLRLASIRPRRARPSGR